jgi:hypothetical protein
MRLMDSPSHLPEAVCVSCGEWKSAPWATCGACGLNPEIDEKTLAQSVYFSAARFDTDEERLQWQQELVRISTGNLPTVPPEEIDRLTSQYRAVQEVGSSNIAKGLFQIFWPALALIMVLVLVWSLLRYL